jgi:DNA invertase Pin-like site-specific DNA recombinase
MVLPVPGLPIISMMWALSPFAIMGLAMKIAFSYIRFSRLEQMRGDSLRRQTKLTADICQRRGYCLDESLTLHDLGVSAFRGKHAKVGALAGFLDAIQCGRVKRGSVLIVESLDRLSRQELDTAETLVKSILRAGVSVLTTNPEKLYTPESVNNIGDILDMLITLYRANEESATKSKRLQEAWIGKRAKIKDRKLTGRIPAWLTLSNDRTKFTIDDEKAAIVRQIYRWCADGMGVGTITRRLNREQVEGIGRCHFWHASYVHKILLTRAVIGEYQPHTLVNGKRVPIGESIAKYYPAIISENLFYRVQSGLQSRINQHGRPAKKMINLFSGLLVDGYDKCSMTLVQKDKPRLVSSGAQRGEVGSEYNSLNYWEFESGFLRLFHELKPADILPSRSLDGDEQEQVVIGRLGQLDKKIKALQDRVANDPDFESAIEIMRRLEQERKTHRIALERIRKTKATPEAEAVQEGKDLISLLDSCKGKERENLRMRIKARLRLLIDRVVVYPRGYEPLNIPIVVIKMRNGKTTDPIAMMFRDGNQMRVYRGKRKVYRPVPVRRRA